MASLKEHKIELLALQDQIARKDNNRTKDGLDYWGHRAKSRQGSLKISTHQERFTSRTHTPEPRTASSTRLRATEIEGQIEIVVGGDQIEGATIKQEARAELIPQK